MIPSTMRSAIFLLLALSSFSVKAFVPGTHRGVSYPASAIRKLNPLRSVQQDEEQATSTIISDEAARLRKEAEMMRLQAEKMDLSLTLQKIEALESKLQNKAWIAKYPDKEAELKVQLQRLNDKLLKKDSTAVKTPAASISVSEAPKEIATVPTPSVSATVPATTEKSVQERFEPQKSSAPKPMEPPLAGFDDCDLELYIPVANDINKMMTNATSEERLEAFRNAPELQAHFQEKVQSMLVGPLEEMQRLETLKNDYLKSSSSIERDSLKREIDRIETAIEKDGPFMYAESVFCDELKPLTDEDLARRVEAVSALPDILITIYKQRNKMDDADDIELAIQVDYYEPQLQLLEQVRAIDPLPEEMRADFVKGFNVLPKRVQDRFAISMGCEAGMSATQVLDKMLEDTGPLSGLMEVVNEANVRAELAEYNDIEFVDRSRYLEEFFPAIGNMEGKHPSREDVALFANQVLDRKAFMVTSKPERVAGGYYIRGNNLLSDEEDGSKTASEKMVERLSKSLEESSLADKLEFFYILDPAPPTDEEMELGGSVDKPVLMVTSKNRKRLYKRTSPLTKSITSLTGLASTFLFSIGACALNPAITDRVDAALEAAKTTGIIDLEWLVDLVFPLFFSLIAIQLVHELAHRIVAAIYKFDIGLPNLIPSITTSITGAITPLRSPPPNAKAMFDFGFAGPAAGLMASIALLVVGLELTASMEMNAQLPVVPVDLVRASSLGGGLVQYFLGSGVAMPDQGPAAMVQLHPYAISGLIGCIINSLALLPLGHTDGGRVSLAMFGRRGAFVVKLFCTLALCVAGIFGLDDVNILLSYVLYTSIWQRELESPARNEVDYLDFPRGAVGISTAIVVGLVLIPMF